MSTEEKATIYLFDIKKKKKMTGMSKKKFSHINVSMCIEIEI